MTAIVDKLLIAASVLTLVHGDDNQGTVWL